MLDYEICTRNKGGNIKKDKFCKQMSSKKNNWQNKNRQEKKANKSEYPAVSNLLISEWK